MNKKTYHKKNDKKQKREMRIPFFQKSFFSDKESSCQQIDECLIFNISSGGINFHALSRLYVGKRVLLLIKNKTRFIKIDAEIVWCRNQSGYLYGARILNQSLELSEFVSKTTGLQL